MTPTIIMEWATAVLLSAIALLVVLAVAFLIISVVSDKLSEWKERREHRRQKP